MTTLPDLKQIFSVHGIDPHRVSQDPPDTHHTDAAFVFTTHAGRRRVRFRPIATGGQRTAWAYTVHDRRGALLDAGSTDDAAPESLLPVLRRHLPPACAAACRPLASPAQLATLTALADPAAHRTTELHPDSPPGRWILGLFVARRELSRRGSINGADALAVLDEAFAAIGLTDDITVDELAVRIDPPGGPGAAGVDEHPAVRLLESHLDRTEGVSDRHLEQARELVEVLRLDNQLVTYRRQPAHRQTGPDNEDRAGWAEAALDAVCARTGDARVCYRDPDELAAVAGDLVANLLHLADRAGLDPELVLIAGMDHHRDESRSDHDPRSCSIPGCTRCEPAPADAAG